MSNCVLWPLTGHSLTIESFRSQKRRAGLERHCLGPLSHTHCSLCRVSRGKVIVCSLSSGLSFVAISLCVSHRDMLHSNSKHLPWCRRAVGIAGLSQELGPTGQRTLRVLGSYLTRRFPSLHSIFEAIRPQLSLWQSMWRHWSCRGCEGGAAVWQPVDKGSHLWFLPLWTCWLPIHLTKGISVLQMVAKQEGVALLMKWELAGGQLWLAWRPSNLRATTGPERLSSAFLLLGCCDWKYQGWGQRERRGPCKKHKPVPTRNTLSSNTPL